MTLSFKVNIRSKSKSRGGGAIGSCSECELNKRGQRHLRIIPK